MAYLFSQICITLNTGVIKLFTVLIFNIKQLLQLTAQLVFEKHEFSLFSQPIYLLAGSTICYEDFVSGVSFEAGCSLAGSSAGFLDGSSAGSFAGSSAGSLAGSLAGSSAGAGGAGSVGRGLSGISFTVTFVNA